MFKNIVLNALDITLQMLVNVFSYLRASIELEMSRKELTNVIDCHRVLRDDAQLGRALALKGQNSCINTILIRYTEIKPT